MMNAQPNGSLAQIGNNDSQAGSALRPNVSSKQRDFLLTPAANDESKSTESKEQMYKDWAQAQIASGTLSAEGVANLTKELEYRESLQGSDSTSEKNQTTSLPNQGAPGVAANDSVILDDSAKYEEWAQERLASGELSAEGVANLTKELDYRKGKIEAPSPNDIAEQENTPGVDDPERAKEALGRLEKVKANQGGFFKRLGERMGISPERIDDIDAKRKKYWEGYKKMDPKTRLAIGLTLTAGSMIGAASGATLLVGVVGTLRLAAKVGSTAIMYDLLNEKLEKKYVELGDVSETRKKLMKAGALATAAFINFGLTDALNNSGVSEKIAEGMSKLGNMLSTTGAPLAVDTMGNPIATPNNEGWTVSSAGNQEVTQGKDPWLEKGPGEGSVYTPGQQPLPVDAALDKGEEITRAEKGSAVSSVTNSGQAPSLATTPVYGFDVASAPPVGSVEVGGDDGTLTGYKLPDGSFMDLDGKITADVAAPEVATPVAEVAQPTPNKYDVRIEESLLKTEAEGSLAAPLEAATPSTNMVLGDGTPVQSGVSALESPATAAPESTTLNEAPAKPAEGFVEADAIIAETTMTTTSPGNQISFAPSTTLSAQDMNSLSALNTLAGTEKFDTAVTSAAKQIDSAKSFLSFGDNSDKIKGSFLTVLQNNPSISVDKLLTADPSSLPGGKSATLKEAQGILKRVIPEDVLAQGSVRESSVVSVLQNNFEA